MRIPTRCTEASSRLEPTFYCALKECPVTEVGAPPASRLRGQAALRPLANSGTGYGTRLARDVGTSPGAWPWSLSLGLDCSESRAGAVPNSRQFNAGLRGGIRASHYQQSLRGPKSSGSLPKRLPKRTGHLLRWPVSRSAARGADRNRTDDGGFADLCLTTWLRRRKDSKPTVTQRLPQSGRPGCPVWT
jgi:hypothetical protein